MTNSTIAHQRLHNQHLVGVPLEKPEDVVKWFGAVQSQDYDGTILRTHLMRPTWHFVMPADIRWMLKLAAPRVNAVNAYYYRKFELDEALFRRSNAALAKALRGGKQLTRTELVQVFKGAGITAIGKSVKASDRHPKFGQSHSTLRCVIIPSSMGVKDEL